MPARAKSKWSDKSQNHVNVKKRAKLNFGEKQSNFSVCTVRKLFQLFIVSVNLLINHCNVRFYGFNVIDFDNALYFGFDFSICLTLFGSMQSIL